MRLGWCGLLITLSSTVLAQHGAELEQFSIQTRKLGQRMEASFKTARRLIDLRDRLFEAKDPDAQLAIVGTYLEVREASVVETRKIIHGLDAVISTAKNTDFVENLADEQVIGTYFDDCDALFGDLQMIEAEARQLATAEVQGPNPYLVAVAEVRKSLADAAELLRKRREGGAMQGIKKDELLKFLKAIRVGLATRQALQLFDSHQRLPHGQEFSPSVAQPDQVAFDKSPVPRTHAVASGASAIENAVPSLRLKGHRGIPRQRLIHAPQVTLHLLDGLQVR